jgi:type I restriction enzyme M protein
VKRDKASLDIFWLKDESLDDSENLPEPEVLASEIIESLETALGEFRAIYEELGVHSSLGIEELIHE